MIRALGIVGLLLWAPVAPAKQLLWGDTHLHTANSFDAFLNANLTADPDTAFRFARGEPVIHPFTRTRVALETPLDFLVVSDHAEFLGALPDIYFHGIDRADAGFFGRLVDWYTTRVIRDAIDRREGPAFFVDALPVATDPREAAAAWRDAATGRFSVSDGVFESTWRKTAESADRHNRPGEFTAFLGWEWSSTPGGANLHRVVFTTADAETAARFLPFASTDSPYPEDLWRWLEGTAEATGAEFIAIPHNSNISKGIMFDERTLRGEAFTREYAELRQKWERVVEATQIKGDSETHPDLSPADPFADFERYPFYIQQSPETFVAAIGDFVRPALLRGLSLGERLGVNPFRLGMIGSTDSHSGLSTADERNFWGKMASDSTPETKAGFSIAGGPNGWSMSASGLAAVWAEENTRESIIAAFKRREVYATTGPRIRLRVFAGAGFAADPFEALLAAGTVDGVPMGGELEARDLAGAAPEFVIVAQKDPLGANLDRLQMIKGWVDAGGNTHEIVHEIAWAGERALDADGRLPPVGNTVDLATGRYANSIGAPELTARWRDPAFDAAESAFYYVRVIEIPTPRHGLLDALALGESASVDTGPPTLQERAYSSPIWYRP